MSLHVTRPELGIIEPCLPSPANAPPSGTGWLHEIKHDGFRIMARLYGGTGARDDGGVTGLGLWLSAHPFGRRVAPAFC
jgi:hypothetical protein